MAVKRHENTTRVYHKGLKYISQNERLSQKYLFPSSFSIPKVNFVTFWCISEPRELSVLYSLARYRKNCGFIPVNHGSLFLNICPVLRTRSQFFQWFEDHILLNLFEGTWSQVKYTKRLFLRAAKLLRWTGFQTVLLIIFQDVLTVFFHWVFCSWGKISQWKHKIFKFMLLPPDLPMYISERMGYIAHLFS